jgi:hypothetical protein
LKDLDNGGSGHTVEIACRFIASKTRGELTSARAMATRCISPPETHEDDDRACV